MPAHATSQSESVGGASRARRQHIIDAGVDLLLAADYDDIQMLEVADEAGVAISTVYRYFPSKEQLFTHVLHEWIQRFPAENDLPTAAGATNAQRMYDLLVAIFGTFERSPHIYRAFYILQASPDPVVRSLWHDMSATAADVYRSALDGVDARTSDMIVQLVAAAIGSQLRQRTFGHATAEQACASLADTVALIFQYSESGGWART